MSITLTDAELHTLNLKYEQANSGTLQFWNIYEWLGDILVAKGVSPTDSSLLWLRGATEANAGRGAMAALIRTYTETQYKIRYGVEIPAGRMQEASDAVAINLIRDLLGENAGWPRGRIPDIGRIALADATAVGRVLFNVTAGDTAAENQQNSAWAGALLFTPLRDDQTGRLISTGSETSIDTLNDIRDVLFAYVSYAKGLQAAFSAYWAGDGHQKDRDFKVLDQTVTGYLLSVGDPISLSKALFLGAANPTIVAGFSAISDVGHNRFLDMLMGAATGSSLLGSTTDANFANKASTFFGAYGVTLQTIGARLLPTQAATLAAQAKMDNSEGASIRAALGALSIVGVDVGVSVAAQFELHNPQTGEGQITTQWIDDRAGFTAAVYLQSKGLGGIVQGQENLRYFDAMSNTEVLVGAGSSHRVQILFGGETADGLNGQGFGDRLYGGAGGDILNGLGGNDYLQGDAGDDTLNGGDGTDRLMGGTGVDTYQFSARFGNDTIIDSDGLGVIEIDGQPITGGHKVTDNVWESTDGKYVFTMTERGLVIGQRVTSGSLAITGATITIQGWSPTKKLGIDLPDTLPASTAPKYHGDQHANLQSGGQYDWDSSTWQPDGTLTNSIAAENFSDVIYGSADDDLVRGFGGNDALDGGAGDGEDRIEGGDGDDLIGGGSGSDVITGGIGNDIILSGYSLWVAQRTTANDEWELPEDADEENAIVAQGATWGVYRRNGEIVINGSANNWLDDEGDVVDGGEGDDVIIGAQGVDALEGGDDNDTIWGMGNGDVIEGGDGDDFIEGDGRSLQEDLAVTLQGDLHGADYINGGQGKDTIYGQGGDDALYGGTEDDFIHGDANEEQLQGLFNGNDQLDGEEGNDALYGGGGDDILDGGDGDDYLAGDDIKGEIAGDFHGNDELDGGDGSDTLMGNGGDDNLFGGIGDDFMYGDEIEDNLLGVHHGDDFMDGEEGDDEMAGGGGGDIMFGGDGNDLMYGDDGTSRVTADFHGDDVMDGQDGDDILAGGGGDDVLAGGSGDDFLIGDAADGTGDDALASVHHGDDTLDGGEGNDQMFGMGGSDVLNGGDGDDYMRGDAEADEAAVEFHGDDTMDGGAGNDMMAGDGGNDVLNGGDGDDALFGGEGNDTLTGGAGKDFMDGGAGDDTYVADMGDAILDTGGAGELNAVQISAGEPLSVSLLGGDLRLYYGSGQGVVVKNAFGGGISTINGTGLVDWAAAWGIVAPAAGTALQTTGSSQTLGGTTGNDVLTALHSNATLDGGAGDDHLVGSGMADTILGGTGANLMTGGGGNDVFYSSGSADIMEGGSGNDTYHIGVAAQDVWIAAGMVPAGAGQDSIVLAGGAATAWDSEIDGRDLTITTRKSVLNSEGVAVEVEGARVVLMDYFAPGSANTANVFADIRFEDGTLITAQQLRDAASIGTEASENIYGSVIADHLQGNGGNDAIYALGGDDTIDAGSGDDIVAAGDGDDEVTGGDGDDVLQGGAGNDTLEGGWGNDALVGGAGNDLLRGGSGNDSYVFTHDDAVLAGGSTDAELHDIIEDTSGNDVLVLGNGWDRGSLGAVQNENGDIVLRLGVQHVVIKGGADAAERFAVEVNGGTLALADLVVDPLQGLSGSGPDPEELDAAELANLEFVNASRALALQKITRAVVDGVYDSPNTSAATKVWETVESDDADIATPGETTTWIYEKQTSNGPTKYRDSSGRVFDTNVVTRTITVTEDYASFSGIEGPVKDGLMKAVAREGGGYGDGGNGTVTSTTTTTTISAVNPDLEPFTETVVTWELVPITTQNAFASAVQLGDSDNSIYIGAGYVHAGGGDDMVMASYVDITQQEIHLNERARRAVEAGATGIYADGGDGNDYVGGGTLDDVIVGGRGFDYLDGGAGADRYLVLDYGQTSADADLIYDTAVLINYEPSGPDSAPARPLSFRPGADTDIVDFGPGIVLSSLNFSLGEGQLGGPGYTKHEGALVVSRDGRVLVTIQRGLGDAGSGIETLRFADGTELSMAQALSMATGHQEDVVGDVTLTEDVEFGKELAYAFGFFSPNGVTYSAALSGGGDLPAWMGLNSSTGGIYGTPSEEDVGNFSIVVTATHGLDSATRIFNIEVLAGNDAPVVENLISDQEATEFLGWSFTFDANVFVDAEGDAITYTASMDGEPLPDWISFDAATRTFSGTPSLEDVGGTTIFITATDSAGLSSSTSFSLSVLPEPPEGNQVLGTELADTLLGAGGRDAVYGLEGDDLMTTGEGDDTLDGGTGADTMIGGAGNDMYYVDSTGDQLVELEDEGYDYVESSADYAMDANIEDLQLLEGDAIHATGNDLGNGIYGNSNDNVLAGGLGDDYLGGGAGNDVYVFSEGDGNDVIYEWTGEGAADTLLLGAGITSADVTLSQVDQSLVVTLTSGDSVVLDAYFDRTSLEPDYSVERIEFHDGTVWDQTSIDLVLVNGGSYPENTSGVTLTGSGTLTGTSYGDTLNANGPGTMLNGGAGDDVLVSLEGGVIWGQTFNGGTGNDSITGSYAGDTYVFNLGDGHDTIHDYVGFYPNPNELVWYQTNMDHANYQDRLNFGAGISAQDVVATRDDDDLVLTLNGGADSITVQRWFEGIYTRLEEINFADGTTWTANYIDGLLGDPPPPPTTGVTLTGSGTLQGTEFGDTLNANGPGTTLNGGAGDDVLVSLEGGVIWGQTFNGGTGNDSITGSYAGDTYVFNLGDGHDTIHDYVGFYPNPNELVWYQTNMDHANYQDRLNFGAGISAQDVVATRDDDDLVLTLNGGADSITVQRWFEGIYTRLEEINFADGTTWTADYIDDLLGDPPPPPTTGVTLTGSGTLQGTEFGDTLNANGPGTTLNGGAGDDTLVSLYGGAVWNHTFNGGTGDDTMTGSYARDVYLFNRGDGHDQITDDVSSYGGATWYYSPLDPEYVDRLVFGAGIAAQDVEVEQVGNSLVLTVNDDGGSVTVNRWLESVYTQIENIEFADGTIWTPVDVSLMVSGQSSGVTLAGTGTLQGTEYDDTLSANGPDTTLIGGAGDDTLVSLQGGPIWDQTFDGGTGNDTITGSYARDLYLFNRGDGQDVISDTVWSYPNAAAANWFAAHPEDPEYHDKLKFGAGIDADELWFRQSGNDLEVSIIGTSDKVTVDDWYSGAAYQIEIIELASGEQLLGSAVQNLVQAMAAFSPPAAGQTSLPTSYQTSLGGVIAANWQ